MWQNEGGTITLFGAIQFVAQAAVLPPLAE